MVGYLKTYVKDECTGCEACVNVCPTNCIKMKDDDELFRYPVIDDRKCINCKLCQKVCPISKTIFFDGEQHAFGCYSKDEEILLESTSGGAFSEIVRLFSNVDIVIFGALTDGLSVRHGYVTRFEEISKFRQSKYAQSEIGQSFKEVKEFLKDGKYVIFSGTPCQISGLNNYLGNVDYEKLITIEVICEGIPSPLFLNSFVNFLEIKNNKKVKNIEYRFKDLKKWDFQVMKINYFDGSYEKMDRWFNPFWDLWLKHLMSRPSCYKCIFAQKKRCSDITLGDLWGVHKYCQDLYNKNRGCSLILTNSKKGYDVVSKLSQNMIIRELNITEAIKYQSPLRKSISLNENREQFINDLKVLKYEDILKKYYKKPNLKLVFKKYVFGNRQRVFLWNCFGKKRSD